LKKEAAMPKDPKSETQKQDRRQFLRTATAGTAGAVVGSMLVGAKPVLAQQQGFRPNSTPIVDILGSFASSLTDAAKVLTKGDLLELAKLVSHEPDADLTNIGGLTQTDILSIQSAFHQYTVNQGISAGSSLEPADTSCCCCCCPACCCAATETSPKRLA
jgi:hypothetical protein